MLVHSNCTWNGDYEGVHQRHPEGGGARCEFIASRELRNVTYIGHSHSHCMTDYLLKFVPKNTFDVNLPVCSDSDTTCSRSHYVQERVVLKSGHL